MFEQGEVVLLKYLYSDYSNGKQRPVIVLKDTNDNDVIVAKITSQIKNSSFDFEIITWKKTGLLKPSIVRCHKIITVDSSIIKMKMGKLIKADLMKIQKIINLLFSNK